MKRISTNFVYKIENIRLLRLFFLSVFFLFLLLGTYIGQRLLREENQRRFHHLNVGLLSEQIDKEFTRRLQVIKALANNSHVRDVAMGRAENDNSQINLALNTANEVAYSELILVINQNGTVISSTDNKTASLTGHNYSFRPYFQESIKGDLFVFPAVGAVTQTRGIYLSAPILSPEDKGIIGVVALKIAIDTIESLLEKQPSLTALVSPDGVIFASNRKEWLFQSVTSLDVTARQRFGRTRQFGDHGIEQLSILLNANEANIDGKNYRIAQSALMITGWSIYSCQAKDVLVGLPPFHMFVFSAAVCTTGCMALLIFFLSTNILHRRRTESMLKKAEEKYYSIFKNATMGIFQCTLAGRYLEVSPSMATILGYETPESLQCSITDMAKEVYFDSSDRDTFVKALEQNDTVKGFETRFIKKDGTGIWVSLSGRTVREKLSQDFYLEVFCLDITEKKKAEDSLRREKNIFSKVMETVPVGIALLDRSQQISFANSRAETIWKLGPSRDHIGNFPLEWFFTELDGTPLPHDENPFIKTIATQETIEAQRIRLQWPNGEDVIISFNIAPMLDRNHKVRELVMAFQDITDKVEAEKKNALQQEQLVMADRMISLGILLSGVAHEINNPNTFILSNAQLFQEAWQTADIILDEYYRENGDFHLGGLPYSSFKSRIPTLCSRIIEGSRRIKRIVHELRQYAAGEVEQAKTNVDLNGVIQSAHILLGNMIKKSTTRFTVNLDPKLPPVRGNFQRLEQVVINIIQNACQSLHSSDDTIVVVTEYDDNSRTIQLTCRDQGIGIPSEHLVHVTDPFFTTKRNIGGVGLGLSISSNIILEHSGHMEISSNEEHGTVVVIRIPAAPERQGE
ncbi:MAG: PAS domain S-box protein [Desulforhopalus sp.]